jgi:hypothetical protein
LFVFEEAYTQQGRAHIRRLHPDDAARPALMRRARAPTSSKAKPWSDSKSPSAHALAWAARFFASFVLFLEEVYTQQGRAHSHRLHPGDAARPALMGWPAHAVESKVVVRIEVSVSPRPCLGCAVELSPSAILLAPCSRGAYSAVSHCRCTSVIVHTSVSERRREVLLRRDGLCQGHRINYDSG